MLYRSSRNDSMMADGICSCLATGRFRLDSRSCEALTLDASSHSRSSQTLHSIYKQLIRWFCTFMDSNGPQMVTRYFAYQSPPVRRNTSACVYHPDQDITSLSVHSTLFSLKGKSSIPSLVGPTWLPPHQRSHIGVVPVPAQVCGVNGSHI